MTRTTPTHVNRSTHVIALEAGTPVAPGDECRPDLNSAHDRALIEEGTLAPAETKTDYAALGVEQLQALAEGAELDVKGSGKDGAVVKDDLVKALTPASPKEN